MTISAACFFCCGGALVCARRRQEKSEPDELRFGATREPPVRLPTDPTMAIRAISHELIPTQT
jgi:hypothetical protein